MLVTTFSFHHVRIPGHDSLHDLRIQDGRIIQLAPSLSASPQSYDAQGGLLLPPLSDPHLHLDAVLTAGDPEPNRSGTLIEGIERWNQRKKYLTEEDVMVRAREAIRWHIAHGVLYIRSHVDVSDDSLTALRALLRLRQELPPGVILQLVAFPQDGIFCRPNGPELMEEALKLGADVVGGIPHYEWTREDGIKDIQLAFDLAGKYHRSIDIHCDETDDDHSRFLETMAKLTLDNQWAGRVTASHTTAMASYNEAYAFKLMRMLKEAGVAIIANPLDNIVLQGRFDQYPKRRGMTRVKELLRSGICVGAGHDSIVDPWYPWGTGNPLFVASMLAHIAQMTGADELDAVLSTVTTNAAQIMTISSYPPTLSVHEGQPANFVIYPVADKVDLIRLMPLPRWVVAAGQILAHTEPQTTQLAWSPDQFEPVTFHSPRFL
ncbi:MAG: cytosine deaminase [Sulfobacillus thermosulfidooxidans]|uniref:Cytosine deaminase n=1 Tax=Sulfobacillus thermosulfidooxidans TaxID=28034 RepID=A0A2T2WSJ5_SULTH|nr:MAG: cytosine deaminase [Sulfobacillus thermosulfidooxidans]